MNPEIKQKWVEALRSGKYKQGYKQLRDENGAYCCLGVLCEVVGKPYTGSHGSLPSSVAELAGVHKSGLLPKAVENEHFLASVNDYLKYDFNQIADIIEEQL
jgi:hypothetical protein